MSNPQQTLDSALDNIATTAVETTQAVQQRVEQTAAVAQNTVAQTVTSTAERKVAQTDRRVDEMTTSALAAFAETPAGEVFTEADTAMYDLLLDAKQANKDFKRTTQPLQDVPVLGSLAKSGAGLGDAGVTLLEGSLRAGEQLNDRRLGKYGATYADVVVTFSDTITESYGTAAHEGVGNLPVVGRAARVPFDGTLGTMAGMGLYDDEAAGAYKPADDKVDTYNFNKAKMELADALISADTPRIEESGRATLTSLPGAGEDGANLALDFAGASGGGGTTPTITTRAVNMGKDAAIRRGLREAKDMAVSAQRGQPPQAPVVAQVAPAVAETAQPLMPAALPGDVLDAVNRAVMRMRLNVVDTTLNQATSTAPKMTVAVATRNDGPVVS